MAACLISGPDDTVDTGSIKYKDMKLYVCVQRIFIYCYPLAHMACTGDLVCEASGHVAPIKDVRWISTGKG